VINRLLIGCLPALGAVLSFTGCSSGSQGECTFDTDCSQLCQICNTSTHKCVDDPVCEDIIQGKCQYSSDCDPMQEICLDGTCVLKTDGGTGGDQGGDDIPEACLNPLLDCSSPQTETDVSQGRDRDHDDWGECCDCDDEEARIHPGRAEIIYNCLDDDCDLETYDDDLDRDNYGNLYRSCNPGSDCDDSRNDIHPNAAEVCDGVDNTCDGQVDTVAGESVCFTSGCPDLTGHYQVLINCLGNDDEEAVDITQNENCEIFFSTDDFDCTGAIDAQLNVYFTCAGFLDLDCVARASVSQSWLLSCADGACNLTFTRTGPITECTAYTDEACDTANQRCGLMCDGDHSKLVCINVIPGGLQPGYRCDPDVYLNCMNEFCFQGVCATACADDTDCAAFPGTSCQAIVYEECDHDTDHTVCAPKIADETLCARPADCTSGRTCTYRQETNQVYTACGTPNAGAADNGANCTADDNCLSGMCVCNNQLCSEGSEGKCSVACAASADCPPGLTCGTVTIKDLSEADHAIAACVVSTDSCGHDADCTVAEKPTCLAYLNPTMDGLFTECGEHGVPDNPNPGQNCQSDQECWSVFCYDFPKYCTSICISDSDCTSMDAQTSCVSDAGCNQGFLCESDNCIRNFTCNKNPFFLGYDDFGAPIVDALNLCTPAHRACTLDSDCRSGEVCKLFYDKLATAPAFGCAVGGPGVGLFDAACHTNQNADCFSNLCLTEGAGGAGNEYCSKPCQVDNDCGNPDDFSCGPYIIYLPGSIPTEIQVCKRK